MPENKEHLKILRGLVKNHRNFIVLLRQEFIQEFPVHRAEIYLSNAVEQLDAAISDMEVE